MKTLKFGSDYQGCAHSFAYANKDGKGENYGNRMFYENDTMFSYGYHFIIAKKVRDKDGDVQFVLVNEGSYSATTNKQQWAVTRALFQKQIRVSTDIKHFKALDEVKAKEMQIIDALDSYNRARKDYTKSAYLQSIWDNLQDIKFLVTYYRIKSKLPARIKQLLTIESETPLIEFLAIAYKRVMTSKKIEATKIRKAQEKYRIEKQDKEKELLDKWRNHEVDRIFLSYITNDALRLSKDGSMIETSQRITLTIAEAKRLLRLVDLNKVVGAKVNDSYTVTAMNGVMKVGCHKITREEIEAMRPTLESL